MNLTYHKTMSRSQRVLLMVHPAYRPDRAKGKSRTESDVWNTLKRCGFKCRIVALQTSMDDLTKAVREFKPQVVFNLLEEFKDEAVYDFHAVTWLESQGIAYTGCSPRGLILTRNKLWMSQLANASGVPAPKTWNISHAYNKFSANDFPLIIKFCNEHASLGLTSANVVRSQSELKRVAGKMERLFEGALIAQSFVAGRELSVSVIGHRNIEVFEPREVMLGANDAIMTERLKFSAKLRHRRAVRARFVPGPPSLINELKHHAKVLFRRLELNGYARFDFRLCSEGKPFLIDVNVNPNLERAEDLALSARRAGYSYEDLLCKLIRMARQYRPQV